MNIAIVLEDVLGLKKGEMLVKDEVDNTYYKLDESVDVGDNSTLEASSYMALSEDIIKANPKYFDLATAEEQVELPTKVKSVEEIREKMSDIQHAISTLEEIQESQPNLGTAIDEVILSMRKQYWTLAWVIGESNEI